MSETVTIERHAGGYRVNGVSATSLDQLLSSAAHARIFAWLPPVAYLPCGTEASRRRSLGSKSGIASCTIDQMTLSLMSR